MRSPEPVSGLRRLRLLWRFAMAQEGGGVAKKFPLHPKNPERICWGCDKYCPADALGCGNGSGRTLHPAEMLGDDWYTYGDWGIDPEDPATPGKRNSD